MSLPRFLAELLFAAIVLTLPSRVQGVDCVKAFYTNNIEVKRKIEMNFKDCGKGHICNTEEF